MFRARRCGVLAFVARASLLSLAFVAMTGCAAAGDSQPLVTFRVTSPDLIAVFDRSAGRWEAAIGISVVRSEIGDVEFGYGDPRYDQAGGPADMVAGTAVRVWNNDPTRKQLLAIRLLPGLVADGYSIDLAVMHEMGHAMRLDSEHTTRVGSIMYPWAGKGAVAQITQEDIDLICAMRDCIRSEPEIP